MKKRTISILVAVSLVVTMFAYIPSMSKKVLANENIPADSGWVLDWSDEFDGSSLDTSIWTAITRSKSDNKNQELQYYRPENVTVSNGCLNIVANKSNGKIYSGRLDTQGHKGVKYGKIESRIKIEGGSQPGMWPAFWMQGTDKSDNAWPKCGEIDIMEYTPSKNYIGGTLHWGKSSNSAHSEGGHLEGINVEQWHTYGMLWNDQEIKFYVDDSVYKTIDISEGTGKENYFNKDYFFLLNLAVGGEYTGYTQSVPDFSSTNMKVDYVRSYKYDTENIDNTIELNSYIEAFEETDLGNYSLGDGINDNDLETIVGVDSNDSSHIAINGGGKSNVTMSLPSLTDRLNSGELFTFEWPIIARGNDMELSSLNRDGSYSTHSLNAGENTIVGEVSKLHSGSNANVFVKMGNGCKGKTIEFMDPIVKDLSGNIVYPKGQNTTVAPIEEPTVAPTETTTEAALDEPTTTTQAPTTATTTTKETTTEETTKPINVAPTTNLPPANEIPDSELNFISGSRTINDINFYMNSNSSARMCVDPYDKNHIRFLKTSAIAGAWDFQPNVKIIGGVKKGTYHIKWLLESDSEETILVYFKSGQNTEYKLNGGINVFETTIKITDGNIYTGLGLGGLPYGTNIDFRGLTITNTDTNEVVIPKPKVCVKKFNVDDRYSFILEDEEDNRYPKEEGYIFAGWYDDESCTIMHDGGDAYAKFIDKDILNVKAQWKNDNSAVRFVSTVDHLDYQEAGFIVSGIYDGKNINKYGKPITKVYSTIKAAGKIVMPSTNSLMSKYFTTYTIRGINPDLAVSFEVTPYYITLDGTKVFGETKTFSRNTQ
ncbi:MAG: glycoside hydrolase family 16 protein [Eubacterium sp.]|nr:glycoside hydrolase family 16 protein [Eubacterium sp.]